MAFWAALILDVPVIAFELWRFVSPGLYSHERRLGRRLLFWALLLFASGGAFGYVLLVPSILRITTSLASGVLVPMPRLEYYLLFVLKTVFVSGLLFELPFAVSILVESGIVEREALKRRRKAVWLGLYLLAVFVSPTDLVSQLLLALPLVGLYELGMALSGLLVGRRRP